MRAMWGVHNDTLTRELVDGAFISIGWDNMGDLNALGGRDDIKAALRREYHDRRPGAIAVWAGIFLRFRDEMQIGDVVVAPYRPDSTVNIGIVAGDYYYEQASADVHPNRRRVDWRRLGIPRARFSERARQELGSRPTVFAISTNVAEFRAALEGAVHAP